jgi:hypothetical protein
MAARDRFEWRAHRRPNPPHPESPVRKLFVTALIVMVAIFLVAPKFVHWASTRPSIPSGTAGLRLAILQHSGADSGAVADSNDVQCVVMDWNRGPRNVVTLVAFADGRTRLYLSPGRVIEAPDRESVREAAARFRAAAEEKAAVPGWFGKTADFDLPANKTMRFFLVTRTGTIATHAELAVVLANKTQLLNAVAEAGQTTVEEIERSR